ncbi:MAG: hypothetical protein ACFFCZ_17775 [Promethearchaeota archaeon]
MFNPGQMFPSVFHSHSLQTTFLNGRGENILDKGGFSRKPRASTQCRTVAASSAET